MRFLFYFRLSGYLLVSSGFLALLITDEYGLIASLVFGALLLVAWLVDVGRFTPYIPRILLNSLTLFWLAFCVIDVVYLRHIMAIGLVNFLVFLQATKLVFPKKNRDYIVIYLLSFFQLLVSSIMTFSVLFALVCLAFIVTGSWALITLHLKQEIQEHLLGERVSETQPGEDAAAFNLPVLNSLVNLKFFSGTCGITIVTCLLSLFVFLILPRAQEGLFFSYGSGLLSQKVSGFSDEVVLDSFGMIRQDHTPVMQIELPDLSDPSGLSERFYWKGISYNFYDGRRWRSDSFQKDAIPRAYRNGQPRFWLIEDEGADTLTRQNVKLLSNRFKVVFGANRLYGVAGRFYHLNYDRFSGNVEVELHPSTQEYVVYSDLSRPNERALRVDSRDYPEEIRRVYLQVPELAERFSELAAGFRGDSANPYDIAVAMLEFLQQNYQYSLQVQRSPDLLPLEDFLFVNKAGHCEYYATAMTILLRLSGIPARVVNGFAQGRWNEFGRFFTVRQSDAHAWVEVFFPSYGWVPFDPTPTVAFGEDFQQFAEQNSVLAGLYRYSEFLRTRWNRYVIDYSLWQQANLAVDSFYALRSAHAKLTSWTARIKALARPSLEALSLRHAAFILGAAAAAVGLAAMLQRIFPDRIFRFPGWRKRMFHPSNEQSRFYAQMLSILARKGVVRKQSVTPGEFASYIGEAFPVHEQEVKELTQVYYAVRYGKRELADHEIQIVEELLRRLRKRPRKSQRNRR